MSMLLEEKYSLQRTMHLILNLMLTKSNHKELLVTVVVAVVLVEEVERQLEEQLVVKLGVM